VGLHSPALLENLLAILQATKKFVASYGALRIDDLIQEGWRVFSIINLTNLVHIFALVLFKIHLIFF
jgi:NADH:ubiquinone oxidoreductase subunit H